MTDISLALNIAQLIVPTIFIKDKCIKAQSKKKTKDLKNKHEIQKCNDNIQQLSPLQSGTGVEVDICV